MFRLPRTEDLTKFIKTKGMHTFDASPKAVRVLKRLMPMRHSPTRLQQLLLLRLQFELDPLLLRLTPSSVLSDAHLTLVLHKSVFLSSNLIILSQLQSDLSPTGMTLPLHANVS